MSTELYGVDAQIVASIGSTPVSTDTNIIFIGACASGDLNKSYLITSMSDYATQLGGAAGDGYNLTEAAIAAFQVAGISKIYMIPVSHSLTFDASDYIGVASDFSGVYAIEDLLRNNPTAVNILCAPGVSDASVLAALKTVATLAAGHWRSFMIYDMAMTMDQVSATGAVDVSEVLLAKNLSDKVCDAVWGRIKTAGGYFISGAAVRACLMAKSDADYDAPARCGGNLEIPSIIGIGMEGSSEDKTARGFSQMSGYGTYTTDLEFNDGTGTYVKLDYIYGAIYEVKEVIDPNAVTQPEIVNNSGKVALRYYVDNASAGCNGVKISITIPDRLAKLTESQATQLSADGVCSYIYYGNGMYFTWCDHPSIYAGGTVADEANRFDNNIRMLMLITNRFQLAHRFEVDEPMTLSMRNDIITYEQDFLNTLKARGALIGNPIVEFRPDQNSTSDLQQGRFVWSIECTTTIPAKYLKAEVAYTSAGLSVYTEEAA